MIGTLVNRKVLGVLFMLSWIVGCDAFALCHGGKLRIALDVGHSERVFGATSANGKPEYFFNKRFSDELATLNSSYDHLDFVVLNPNGKELNLVARSRLAAALSVDLLLSIHHDSVQSGYLKRWVVSGREQKFTDTQNGYSIFVADRSLRRTDSLTFARSVGEMLKSSGLVPSLHHAELIPGEGRKLLDAALGVYEAPFLVLTSATIPAVLLEVGVISNRNEEALLDAEGYRQSMQLSIARALDKYCKRD